MDSYHDPLMNRGFAFSTNATVEKVWYFDEKLFDNDPTSETVILVGEIIKT